MLVVLLEESTNRGFVGLLWSALMTGRTITEFQRLIRNAAAGTNDLEFLLLFDTQ